MTGQNKGNLSRKDLYFLILLFLGAVFLRSVFLGRESLWLDEVMTATRTQWSYFEMIRSIAQRDHLPFYYTIMWSWAKLFGNSEIAVRSVSVIMGSMAVIPIYFIGRRSGRKEALLIGGLSCTMPVLVYFGQEAKMYSLLILLSSISFLAFLELNSPIYMKRRTAGLVLMISNIFLVYTHYYSYLFVGAQALAMLLIILGREELKKDIPKKLIREGWAIYLPLILSLPWWIFLINGEYLFSLSTGGGISLTIPGILSIIPFLTGSYKVPDGLRYLPMMLVSVLVLISIGMGSFGRRNGDQMFADRKAIWVIVMFIPLSSLLISILLINIYGQRYFLILVPVILFLSVLPVIKGKIGRIRNVIVISAIVLSIFANGIQYLEIEKDDWRGAVGYIEEDREDGDVIVPVPFWERRSIEYYGPELNIAYGSNSEDLDRSIGGSGRVWLIVRGEKDDGWTFDHLEENFGGPLVEKKFEGLTIYLFHNVQD